MLFLRVSGAEDRVLEAGDDFLKNFEETGPHFLKFDPPIKDATTGTTIEVVLCKSLSWDGKNFLVGVPKLRHVIIACFEESVNYSLEIIEPSNHSNGKVSL